MGALATWRGASARLAEADAETCLPCNGRPGRCTCSRRGCATCGCPELRHRHLHPRDYCGTCEGCDSYTPRRWWHRFRR